jgi:hypothetical protein
MGEARMEEATNEIPPITAPTDAAAPAEVRTYFSTLLSQKDQTSQAAAHDMVKPWRYGTSVEVKSFSIDTYRGFFGREIVLSSNTVTCAVIWSATQFGTRVVRDSPLGESQHGTKVALSDICLCDSRPGHSKVNCPNTMHSARHIE